MVLGLPRLILCLVLSRADCQLPTKTAQVFLSHFLKGMVLSSFFLSLVPVQCKTRMFCTLSFAQSCKISV